ncbi:GNAT family N-acetyltransferase [Salinarchaeum sp. IM2453]|uniref:GNAT family N-acetyltransferase n=1 Tax=Salinarchaeum sp. IM2453 TaxID=2862870 RepID=UPI001C82927E|nr:GNAT family N-acetyltransferase [Salinarchaeum sp. IM2453]QZA87672.1 GNAT family N-acetyltransferase [Salinarchaeum sp. IM2453]
MIEKATPDDRLALRRLIDSVHLIVNDLPARIADSSVYVKRSNNTVLGAIVLRETTYGAHIEAIVVRKRRRNSGIGTELVKTAIDRYGVLTMSCQSDTWPFWASLGFRPLWSTDQRVYAHYESS